MVLGHDGLSCLFLIQVTGFSRIKQGLVFCFSNFILKFLYLNYFIEFIIILFIKVSI
ncbi:MAG: sodium:proton antiporter [Neisseria sp.]|nr:MAG: sodium:proton antiporter [Neisseria sp.]